MLSSAQRVRRSMGGTRRRCAPALAQLRGVVRRGARQVLHLVDVGADARDHGVGVWGEVCEFELHVAGIVAEAAVGFAPQCIS